MTDEVFIPRLYVIMRDDLWDLNPGKGMAQSAHAGSDFEMTLADHTVSEVMSQAVANWREDRTFGTTLVLSAPKSEFLGIRTRLNHAQEGTISGTVLDPTYPYRNWYGQVFTAEEVTCMWVFAYTQEHADVLSEWDLHI